MLCKATIYYILVRPSVRMEQPVFHYTDLPNILNWGFLIKSVGKIKICFKCDKNDSYCTWKLTSFYFISISRRLEDT